MAHANQMTGFYISCNAEPKWFNSDNSFSCQCVMVHLYNQLHTYIAHSRTRKKISFGFTSFLKEDIETTTCKKMHASQIVFRELC